MVDSTPQRPRPVLDGAREYSVPRAAAPIDLWLDGNEGLAPPPELLRELADAPADLVRRYPKKERLEAALAARHGVEPSQVIVTNGGDDAIDRVCRAYLDADRNILIPEPGFSMIDHYARVAGGTPRPIPWPGGPFPIDAYLEGADAHTTVMAVVSPNNPTGAVVKADDLRRLSEERPDVLLLVDLAYVEFADDDLTQTVLELSNAVAVRTFSKAWGLAGLRVGYAIGPTDVVGFLRAAGGPYPVSAASLFLAERRLEGGRDDVARFVGRIRVEREELADHLKNLDFEPFHSQGNFVFVDVENGTWCRDALAGMGIAVRAFPGKNDGPVPMERCVRITCPGDEGDFDRLTQALDVVYRPEAFLLDMDGILADVSGSYREAIIRTAGQFGVEITAADVAAVKAEGDANNDWVVTRRILAREGVYVSLEEVTDRFEAFYQGEDGQPGLRERESLIMQSATLEALNDRGRVAIVTGRPRTDAERFLARTGIDRYFEAVVCMEDAALKPDPAPLFLALEQLGVERAWFVGDTPDDMRAARAAGALPIGCVAPGEERDTVEPVLVRAGAARVLDHPDDLLRLLGDAP